MAVGPNFSSPETQAAIAAASGDPVQPAAQAPATEAAEPAAKPVEEANEPTTTPEKEHTPTEKPVETPTAEPSPEKSAEVAADTDMTKVKVPDQAEVDKALESAGFSNEKLGKELVDNDGKLSDETIASLKEHFDPAAVDNTVKDMEAQYAEKRTEVDAQVKETSQTVQDMNNYIYGELAGGDVAKGQENLKVLSDWAQENIPADHLAAINAKLQSGNKLVVKEALESAVGLWKKGQERPMMTGDSAAVNKEVKVPALQPITKDQYIKEMASKKYQEDTEYADIIDTRRRKTLETEGFTTIEYSGTRMPIR